MSSKRLSYFGWLAWLLLALTVAAGGLAQHLSSQSARAELRLIPGESVDISLFRLLPANLSMSLQFEHKGDRRPELGKFQLKYLPQAGALEFKAPGAGVKLAVAVRETGAGDMLEAMPAASFGDEAGRELVRSEPDGDPRRFSWPGARPVAPLGFSTLHVSVLEVGPALTGERVGLVVAPPLSFKAFQPGYELFWWFLWWPVYVVVLSAAAIRLAWEP